MNKLSAWFNRLVGKQDPDITDFAEQLADHRDVCLCEFSGRMVEGGLIGKCEPHLASGLRDCRWHAHTFHRPLSGEYEGGPG